MIVVKGGTVSQKSHVTSIVNFCINIMMPRLVDKLDITVRLRKNMLEKEGHLGTCIWDDEDYNGRAREFAIEVDSGLKLRTLLMTVAHEMVHAKQMARGEMRYMMRENNIKWMGKTVNTASASYWDYPWEIEAHGREQGLFIRWRDSNGHGLKNWAQIDI